MWSFKRRNKAVVDSNLPPEVQAYSQAEHRERMGMAWLVGIVSLLVSLLVVTSLFFGGRWLYRKIARSDRPTPAVTAPAGDRKKDDKKDQGSNNDNSSSTGTDANANSGSEPTTDTPLTPDSSSPTQTPSTQPVTGDQGPTGTLPSTGPDVDL